MLCWPRREWPTNQRPRATYLSVLPQRATSYTWAHMNISPSLHHSHTYLCSVRSIANITHQHDNDRNLQAIYSYEHLVQNFCHLYTIKYGMYVPQEPRETRQRAASWPGQAERYVSESTMVVLTFRSEDVTNQRETDRMSTVTLNRINLPVIDGKNIIVNLYRT